MLNKHDYYSSPPAWFGYVDGKVHTQSPPPLGTANVMRLSLFTQAMARLH